MILNLRRRRRSLTPIGRRRPLLSISERLRAMPSDAPSNPRRVETNISNAPLAVLSDHRVVIVDCALLMRVDSTALRRWGDVRITSKSARLFVVSVRTIAAIMVARLAATWPGTDKGPDLPAAPLSSLQNSDAPRSQHKCHESFKRWQAARKLRRASCRQIHL